MIDKKATLRENKKRADRQGMCPCMSRDFRPCKRPASHTGRHTWAGYMFTIEDSEVAAGVWAQPPPMHTEGQIILKEGGKSVLHCGVIYREPYAPMVTSVCVLPPGHTGKHLHQRITADRLDDTPKAEPLTLDDIKSRLTISIRVSQENYDANATARVTLMFDGEVISEASDTI